MSQQTAIPLTPEQAREADMMARRRALLNRGAGTIFVQTMRNGQPATVPLTSLPPTERAKVMQQLLTVPGLQIPNPSQTPAPAPAVADAPASSGTAPSRFTTRTKRTTTSVTKKATTKKRAREIPTAKKQARKKK